MANIVEGDWMDHRGGNRFFATPCFTIHIRLAVLLYFVCAAVSPVGIAADSHAAKGISRRVNLDGPANTGAMASDVVQVLDSDGEPREYFMDVDSVVCADATCEIVTVRIHFDPLGNYQRYELPSGGNLTKWGHKPFSLADHERLHQILSEPYSRLKSIGWDEITVPTGSAVAGDDVDGVSGATALSKRSVVVVGAAYTCYTLWHWSHGEVANAIREMTVLASDKQDLIRYLHSDNDAYVVFATDQLRMQNLFDAESIAAV